MRGLEPREPWQSAKRQNGVRGTRRVPGRVGYVEQTEWIHARKMIEACNLFLRSRGLSVEHHDWRSISK
jgi:hypothetical protein